MTFWKSPCRMVLLIRFLILLGMVACQSPRRADTPFESGIVVGVNSNEKLKEASGLAASTRYPGHLWSHNDSGHHADLFLLDETGKTTVSFRLAKIKNRDWEDIAIGPGPKDGAYIYIGDIGDNEALFPYKYIYRLREPDLNHEGKLHDVDTLTVKLPDKPRDTETLMIDPLTKNLFLVTKREKEVRLYEIAYPFLTDTLVATQITSLPMRQIVAGDISRDGREVLLKSYDHIYYWKRAGRESVGDLLKTPAIELDYNREPLGEAIAWAADGSGFFTMGENAKGRRGTLIFYKRRPVADSTVAPTN